MQVGVPSTEDAGTTGCNGGRGRLRRGRLTRRNENGPQPRHRVRAAPPAVAIAAPQASPKADTTPQADDATKADAPKAAPKKKIVKKKKATHKAKVKKTTKAAPAPSEDN